MATQNTKVIRKKVVTIALVLYVSFCTSVYGVNPLRDGVHASVQKTSESSHRNNLRSKDHLVEVIIYKPKASFRNEVIENVRKHWSTLRSKGFATATPIVIVASDDDNSVRYTFKWGGMDARSSGSIDRDLARIEREISEKCVTVTKIGSLDEVYQGFDYSKFPATGGIELLKGKCNSEVKLVIDEEVVELNVLNGFVLMHRSPGHDVDKDGNREMYIEILQHGGDIPKDGYTGSGLQVYRVGQNDDLPQYGLIRAHSQHQDFPATAVWVVHWKIWTSIGTVITDPNTPLVFGPSVVHHYPPVGTEFFSSTGPVNLIHEDTGEIVGTLSPKELTAFDIVVTKDDEIESIVLNKAPQSLVKLFDQITSRKKNQINQ